MSDRPPDADFTGTYLSTLTDQLVSVSPHTPYHWTATYDDGWSEIIGGVELSLRLQSGLWQHNPPARRDTQPDTSATAEGS